MCTTERGQALPLGLALMAIGMLGALVLYDTGRMASDKARLANAADAAAYSGLQWQARALNFQAYTNRAMVANQVSIAQAVSLNSWTTYGAMTSDRLADALSPIPPAAAFARGLAQGMHAVDKLAGPLTTAMVGIVDIVNGALSVSQEALFQSAFVATPEIVRDVVAASDPDFESDTAYSLAGLHRNLDDWQGFTESFAEDDMAALTERKDLVNASRDGFSRKRYWEFFENFWFMPTLVMRHKLFREGDTRLILVEGADGPRWEWKAKDTLALQSRLWRPFRSEKKFEVPISWAETYANERGEREGSVLDAGCRGRAGRGNPECRFWTTKNHSTERLAHLDREGLSGYKGLRAFRSIAGAMRDREDEDPVMRLRIEVAMPLEALEDGARPTSGSTFDTGLVAPGDRLSSISVAELHYRRPDAHAAGMSSERGREAANGYNPYWTVRLGAVELEERLLAVGLRPAGSGPARPFGAASPVALAAYGGEGGEGADGGPAGEMLAGAGDRLGTYADTLATAHGVEAGALDERLAGLSGVGVEDIEGFVGEAASGAAEAVEEELRGALEGVVGRLLQGVVSSATGRLAGMRDELENNPHAEAVQDGIDVAQDLTDELRELRQTVQDEFTVVLQTELPPYREPYLALVRRIERVRAGLPDTPGEGAGASLLELLERRQAMLETLAHTLATQLIEIVDANSDTYDMPWDLAAEVVWTLIAHLSEYGFDLDAIENDVDVEGALPW